MHLFKLPKLPNTYTILFTITLGIGILSHFIVTGRYDYKTVDGKTIIKAKDASSEKQIEENLIPIPHSYKPLGLAPQSLMDVAQAPIKGVESSIELILFVLMLGSFLEVVHKTKTINAMLTFVLLKLRFHKVLIIPIMVFIFSLGGSIFGFKEESIIFFPILITFMFQLGFDPLLGVATVLIGSSVGILGSTVNPFAVGTAIQVAGISIHDGMNLRVLIFVIGNMIASSFLMLYAKKITKNPKKSLIHKNLKVIAEKYLLKGEKRLTRFNKRRFFVFIIFVATFGFMTYHLLYNSKLNAISGIFILASISVGIIGKIPEKEFIFHFKKGASDILPIGLIIGISRGVTLILNDSRLKDTLLNKIESVMHFFPPVFFILMCFFVIFALYFLISSSSGMAMLIIPILTPLATLIGAPVSLVIIAYLGASGIAPMINPAGAILGTALDTVGISYSSWIKWISPFIIILSFFVIFSLIFAFKFIN